MTIDTIEATLKQSLQSLLTQAEKVKKALEILSDDSVVLLPPTDHRGRVSAATKDKIRQAALKRWAEKRKALASRKRETKA